MSTFDAHAAVLTEQQPVGAHHAGVDSHFVPSFERDRVLAVGLLPDLAILESHNGFATGLVPYSRDTSRQFGKLWGLRAGGVAALDLAIHAKSLFGGGAVRWGLLRRELGLGRRGLGRRMHIEHTELPVVAGQAPGIVGLCGALANIRQEILGVVGQGCTGGKRQGEQENGFSNFQHGVAGV